MTHFVVLIIIPKKVFLKGQEYVIEYINETMENYDEENSFYDDCNKDALFDWFEIGGRWNGLLTGNINKENMINQQNDFNFHSKDKLENNSVSIKDFLIKFNNDKKNNTFNHLIDKDGLLFESGKTGMFGTFDKKINDDEWEIIFERKLKNAEDDYLVNLDCHI